MLVLPLGHDRDTLRRWPVVTFAIMAACTLAFLAGELMARPDADEIQARFEEAVDYWLAHQSLAVDPFFLQHVEAALADAEETATEAEPFVRPAPGPPEDPTLDLTRERQKRFDALVGAWLGAVRVGPHARFGLIPREATWQRFFTHMFVHADFLHLLFNMLFLYMTAPFIEDLWGRPAFLGFYLFAGVVSAACFTAWYPNLAVPLVGASGAIAGVMGAFFVRLPRTRLKLVAVAFAAVLRFSAPAWVALLAWVGGEYAMARFMDWAAPGSGGGGVAYWVHVSGFAFGAATAGLIGLFAIEQRHLAPAIDAALDGGSTHDVLRKVDRALQAQRLDEAWQALRTWVVAHPADDDAALAYWDLAQRLDRTREASAVMLRLVRRTLASGDHEGALRHWDDLRAAVPDVAPGPDLAVKVAEHLLATGARAEAAALLREALARVDPRADVAVMATFARTAAAADPALGADAAARALAHPGLPPAARAALQELANRTH